MGAKNLIVCCDGTGQSYVGPTSNVLQIYELALKHPGTQVACYDPGVGTLPAGARSLGGRWLRRGAELWLGWGAIENVTELYRYLMQHHEQDDKIFLFGFSRGAFTVRALAAMIHVCGLLRRDDEHLLPYAAGLFQTSERRIAAARESKGYGPRVKSEPGADHAKCDCEAALFKERLSIPCTIEFLGLWDTVKAYGWFWPQSFPAPDSSVPIRLSVLSRLGGVQFLFFDRRMETGELSIRLDSSQGIVAAPGWLDFGSQPLRTSSSQQVTVSNTGSAPVAGLAISVGAPFSVTHDCTTLAAGASCQATVTFTPTAAGGVAANVLRFWEDTRDAHPGDEEARGEEEGFLEVTPAGE